MYPDLSQEELNNIDIDEEALLNAAETLIPTLRVRDTPALTAPANTPEPVATTEEPTTSTNQIDSSTTPESTNTEESTASQLPAVT